MAKQTIGSNPFTPRSGHEPKVFLGRESEKLETAIRENLKDLGYEI